MQIKGAFFMNEDAKTKIVLPDELQKKILKFFLKTSIPRIVKETREKNKASDAKNENLSKGEDRK